MSYLFTSESVTEGHPDKICDKISDSILDAILSKDENARVACETFTKTGLIVVGGEITTDTYVNIPDVVRKAIRDIGYTDGKMGLDWETCGVMNCIEGQSPDIAQGVSKEDQGAGDQGLMFGYACDETDELMPLPIILAHKLAKQLTDVRRNGTIDFLRPDGKTQVTVEYDDNHQPLRVDTIVVSAHHKVNVSQEEVKKEIETHVINPICKDLMDENTKIFINPTGKFEIGGPQADAGLTGRKIIVDTYGGMGRHGGGAFSGKDPSKVDRSAAYAARYIAKNIVAAKLARKCEVQLAYAIGISEPVSIKIDTFGTGTVPEKDLIPAVRKVFPTRPGKIIRELDLKRPIYAKTASYGHFGRSEPEFTWEKTNKVEELKQELSE
ncbi:MAG: methionine adenosyltransferase [Candidatus Woesearchaeota archaeon]